MAVEGDEKTGEVREKAGGAAGRSSVMQSERPKDESADTICEDHRGKSDSFWGKGILGRCVSEEDEIVVDMLDRRVNKSKEDEEEELGRRRRRGDMRCHDFPDLVLLGDSCSLCIYRQRRKIN